MNIKKNIGNGKPRQVHVPYSPRTLSITCSTRSHNSPCLLTSSSTPQRRLVAPKRVQYLRVPSGKLT